MPYAKVCFIVSTVLFGVEFVLTHYNLGYLAAGITTLGLALG